MKALAGTRPPSCLCSSKKHAHQSSHQITSLPAACAPQQQPGQPPTTSSSCRHNSSTTSWRASRVVARIYKNANHELADVTREVWDDEEDVQAAAAKLGYDRDSLEADSGPLVSDINEWYVEQRYPDQGHLGQLELRFIPGKGYGLVATQNISQGTVLAVCLPLAWVSGPPGQPPPLEALVGLLRGSCFTAQQRRVLASLASSPDLDAAHEAAVTAAHQDLQQDVLLRAAQDLQDGSSSSSSGGPPGFPAGSLPLSRTAELQRQQRQLAAASEYTSWELDEEEDGDDSFDSYNNSSSSSSRFGRAGEEDALTDYDADDADRDPSLAAAVRRQQQLQQQLQLDGGSSSGSSVRRLGGSSGGRGLLQQQRGYRPQRRAPDLLEFLQCTQQPADPAAAAAGVRAAALLRGDGSSAAAAADSEGGGMNGLPLNLPLDRLSALVCRNALLQLSQDLVTSSIRGDPPVSLTGIWPLLTLFNHSCAPNAVSVTLGHLQQQQEGREGQTLLQPPQQQQQRLRGFGQKLQQRQQQQPVNPWSAKGSNGSSGGRSSGSSSELSQRGVGGDSEGGGGLQYSGQPGRGPFVLIRAVADLAAGDEVTLDYLSGGLEGSLVHGERRRAALVERWGFVCRCERCIAEQRLGESVNRALASGNTLAARLGPKVAAAAAAAAAGDGSAPGPAAAAAAAGESRVLLQRYAEQLNRVIQGVEEAVDHPRIPDRAAAWAHASIYQVHALYAVCRSRLAPTTAPGLTPLGTAAELAGLAAPGCPTHLLGLAALVSAAADAWGGGDARVEGTLQGLMQAVQVRYGPLQAGVSSLLIRGAQLWAHRTEGVPLALLSPAAAAAMQARKHYHARTPQQQQGQEGGEGVQGAERGWEGEEEQDEIAAELAAQAERVVDVDDMAVRDTDAAGSGAAGDNDSELLLWDEADDTAAAAAAARAGEQQQGVPASAAGGSSSRKFDVASAAAAARAAGLLGPAAAGSAAAAATTSGPAAAAAAAGGEADDDLVFVRKRSEAEVVQELQLYAGYRAALPPEQQQQLLQQQQQQQQQALASDSFAAGVDGADGVGGGGGVAGSGSSQAVPAGSESKGSEEEQEGVEEGEGEEGMPLLASWLQGSSAAADIESEAAAAELTPAAAALRPPTPAQEQQQQQQQGSAKVPGRPGSSSSSGRGKSRAVSSVFGSGRQQAAPQQPQQQAGPAATSKQPVSSSSSSTPASRGSPTAPGQQKRQRQRPSRRRATAGGGGPDQGAAQ